MEVTAPLRIQSSLYMEVIDVEHKETQPALAGVKAVTRRRRYRRLGQRNQAVQLYTQPTIDSHEQ